MGNHFIGGTIYDDGYNGTAIILGAALSSAGSQGGAFPLPGSWTALPSLGAVIQDNIIQDSLAGIQIGVEHNVNYWAVAGHQHQRVRASLRIGGGHRQHLRVRFRVPPGVGDAVRRPGQ